jgi:hypothetical protein
MASPGRADAEPLLGAIRARVLELGEEPAPPATPRQIAAAEAALGFSLPAILRLLLSEVGNGGFGPGGLMGIEGGATDDQGDTLQDWYLFSRQHAPKDPTGRSTWPLGLIPLCAWGCGVYSCVDCTRPEHPIVRFDPSGGLDHVSRCLSPEGVTLRGWLEAWAAGSSDRRVR